MPSRRLSAILGPLIALLLIGGVTAAVLGGPDDSDTDLAAEPTEDVDFSEAPSESASPAVEQTPQSPAPTEGGVPTGGGTPTEGGTPPPATPQPAPTSGTGDIGSDPAVDDGSLTGGWVGGTPNTGTAVSAAGLLLLSVAGGLLWLRRSRA